MFGETIKPMLETQLEAEGKLFLQQELLNFHQIIFYPSDTG